MCSHKSLYIDSEGLQRGYYVYLHKDRATGAVFYVGKGHGRRAWDALGRNDVWKARTKPLTDGWDVVIVKDNLSEIEAFELEAQLVEKYGGAIASGGQLTNYLPGGESPASVEIGMVLNDKGWSQAYYKFREFNKLTRREQENFANNLKEKLKPIFSQLADLENEGDESNNDQLFDSASTVTCIVYSLIEIISDYMRRRVSWKELGIGLEDAITDLKWELKEYTEHHHRVLPTMKMALEMMTICFTRIDSGNRASAEEQANKAVRE